MQISVHEELDVAVERLKQGLPEAIYLQVLELLAAQDAVQLDPGAPPAMEQLEQGQGSTDQAR